MADKIALISFVTIAEMLYWAEKNNWGQNRRDDLDRHLRLTESWTPPEQRLKSGHERGGPAIVKGRPNSRMIFGLLRRRWNTI